MRLDYSLKYEVSVNEIQNIQSKLKDYSAQQIMNNKLMQRTIFCFEGADSKNWIRIRTGDVNVAGDDITVITFKKITPSRGQNKREAVINVQVDDYDTAVELLQEFGLVRKSRQENRRSKYICEYNDDKYAVSIDEWPWLENIRIITINPLGMIEYESIVDFAESMQLTRNHEHKGGVDAIYKKHLHIKITDVFEVNFHVNRNIK